MRALLLTIAVLFATLVAGFFIFGAGYKSKANTFFGQMKRTTTPSQIQDWALEEIARAGGDRVELDTRPEILNATDDGLPNYVYVESSSNGEPYVVAQWGSGFGHWGLLVGASSLKYPIDGYYHIEWAPGVYVWHEME